MFKGSGAVKGLAFQALALRGRQAAEPRGEVGCGRLGREGE
jgi:hypothetical protein